TGSALWEPHITATSRSENAKGDSESDTAACRGFIEDRANSSRSGSPADATIRPSADTATTCPACTASSRPERMTRAMGTEGIEPGTYGLAPAGSNGSAGQTPLGDSVVVRRRPLRPDQP